MSNRRVVKKQPLSKDKISDKKISTKDQANKITKANYFLLGATPKNNKLKITIKNENPKKALTLIPTTTESSPPTLEELKEKTSKLEEELNYLNYKYEKEQKGSINDVAKYNEELREKTQLVFEHSQENKRLMNFLKDIQEDVNKRYSKAMDKKFYKLLKNNNNNERTIEDIKKDINMRDEQINNARKIAETTQAEYEKLEDLLEDVNNGLEEHVKFDLEDLTKKINKINNKIRELKLIKSQHKYCAKDIKNLKSKLSLLTNEIEFETKKNKMIMSYKTLNNNIEGDEEPEESEDFNYFDKENDLVINKINYSLKVRDLMLKRGTPRHEKLSKSAFKYIQNEFDLMKQKSDRIRKRRTNGERARLFDNISVTERNLFTERESKILKKIIPEEFLDKYNERFEMKKIEKEEIEQKFEENDDIKFDNQQIKLRIEGLALQVKEKERIGTDLNIKFRKNKVKIDKIKHEILKIKKNIKNQQGIINILNNKNKGYFKAIQNFLKKKYENEE